MFLIEKQNFRRNSRQDFCSKFISKSMKNMLKRFSMLVIHFAAPLCLNSIRSTCCAFFYASRCNFL